MMQKHMKIMFDDISRVLADNDVRVAILAHDDIAANNSSSGSIVTKLVAQITNCDRNTLTPATCAKQLRQSIDEHHNKPVCVVIPDVHAIAGDNASALAQLIHTLTSDELEGAPVSLLVGTAAAVCAPGTNAYGIPGLDAHAASRLDAVTYALPSAATRGDAMLRTLYLTGADDVPLTPLPARSAWTYLMGKVAEAGGSTSSLSRALRAFAALHFANCENNGGEGQQQDQQQQLWAKGDSKEARAWRAAHARWSCAVSMLAAVPSAAADSLSDVIGLAFASATSRTAAEDLANLVHERVHVLRQNRANVDIRAIVAAWVEEARRLTPDLSDELCTLASEIASGNEASPPSSSPQQSAARLASDTAAPAPAPAPAPALTPPPRSRGAAKASKRRRTDFYDSLMMARQREEAEHARRSSAAAEATAAATSASTSTFAARAADLLERECEACLLKEDSHLAHPSWRAEATPSPEASAKALRALLEANPRDAISGALLRPHEHGVASRRSSTGKVVAVGACAAYAALRRHRATTKRKERDVASWFYDFADAMGLAPSPECPAAEARASLAEAQARLAQASWELAAVGAASSVVAARGGGGGAKRRAAAGADGNNGASSGLAVRCLL